MQTSEQRNSRKTMYNKNYTSPLGFNVGKSKFLKTQHKKEIEQQIP